MDWYSEEILSIAWDNSKDTIKREGKPDLCNHEWIGRSRLKVDTLKFLMAKLYPKRYGDRLPETVEQRTHEAALLELVANEPMKITWEREIISPIHDDHGNIIGAHDNAKLRARIRELEERLGIQDGKPQPPKLIAYDPGPLPKHLDPDVLVRLVDTFKRSLPQDDQRDPEAVLDEATDVIAKALRAHYGTAGGGLVQFSRGTALRGSIGPYEEQ